MTESQWDKLLKIRTTGRDDSRSDQYHYPYEPTPYPVLERLAQSGYIKKTDVLLDYGCGKGRVDYFLSWQTRCRSIGIDYDSRMIRRALCNKESASSAGRVTIVQANAEHFTVPADTDRCYFFNPFSLRILRAVIKHILSSWYENPREILLFFYYPSDEYISFLMTVDEMMFLDEIDCRDLFEGENSRERIMIFSLSPSV